MNASTSCLGRLAGLMMSFPKMASLEEVINRQKDEKPEVVSHRINLPKRSSVSSRLSDIPTLRRRRSVKRASLIEVFEGSASERER
jgi:hypothetical protein